LAKRVLIVQGSVGGAHLSMAQAISERVLTLEPLVKVDSIDAYSAEYSSFPMTATPKLYRFLTTSCPVLWNGLYHATDGYSRYTLTERLTQPLHTAQTQESLTSARAGFCRISSAHAQLYAPRRPRRTGHACALGRGCS
jgi:hypothetical protein